MKGIRAVSSDGMLTATSYSSEREGLVLQCDPNQHAAPRWRLTAWLAAPATTVEAEVAAELRAGMFRRLEAVLASSVAIALVAALIMLRHPGSLVWAWSAATLAILLVRVAVVIAAMRADRRQLPRWGSVLTDMFIVTGIFPNAVLGLDAFLCFALRDQELALVVGLVAIAVATSQSGRSPGSPRLNTVYACLTMIPLAAGLVVSGNLLLCACGMILAPIHLMTIANISRQLHEDFVATIVARVENRRRALHCALTGLPNGACFRETLSAALGAAGPQRPVAVLCLDLDGFKGVNDALGHPAGDDLLQQVAGRLRGLAGPSDLAARLGGDEFAVILQGRDLTAAQALAARIVAAIGQPFVLHGRDSVAIGTSVGIAVAATAVSDAAAAASALVAQADAALYAAKRSGKGTVRHHRDGAPPEADAAAPAPLRVPA